MKCAVRNHSRFRKGEPRIGNTPIKSIVVRTVDGTYRLQLKLEGMNPFGSIKDRTADALVKDVERRGLLRPGSTIVESTSGNLGVALAAICRLRGYRFVAVVDPKVTPENLARMRAQGAILEVVGEADEHGSYLSTRVRRVREICASSDKYQWTAQYTNPANPGAHYNTTGPEIYRQTGGLVDAVFVAASTGGTLAGIGRFFRELGPVTSIVAVDAVGSSVFGMPPGRRYLTGIGSSQPSYFLNPTLYDERIDIGDGEAFAFCRGIADATGLRVGGSSGAVIAACIRHLRSHPTIENPICLCADSGDNYASTIYSDRWTEEKGIDVPALRTMGVLDISLSGSESAFRNRARDISPRPIHSSATRALSARVLTTEKTRNRRPPEDVRNG